MESLCDLDRAVSGAIRTSAWELIYTVALTTFSIPPSLAPSLPRSLPPFLIPLLPHSSSFPLYL